MIFDYSVSKSILENQVAGGDGTASWLLGVVSDLKLPHPPPIATVPLGTGNNLPFAFGWVFLFNFLFSLLNSEFHDCLNQFSFCLCSD